MTGQFQQGPGDLTAAAKQGDAQAQFQLARHALQRGDEQEFRHWIQQSAGQEFPPALFRLGTWRLSQVLSPTETEDALQMIRRAADLGFINAIRAMVVLSIRGTGALPDWAEGMTWFKKAIQLNDARAYREAALLLENNPGNRDLTLALLAHAAGSGDVLAAYHLGLLLLDGGSERARDEGVFWLSAAFRGGHVLAARELMPYRECTIRQPAGALPAIDWKDLDKRLSAIREPFEPFESETVLEDPKARVVKDVLAKWECDYLIQRASRYLEPAQTSQSVESGQAGSDYRTNSGSKFWPLRQDIVICMIDRKMALAAETPVDCAEDMVVLNYKPGERYYAHCDGFLPDLPDQAAEIERKGQRIRTCLVYLNEDFEDGETYFLYADRKVRCKTGNALIFENVTDDGAPDEHSVHEGLPVSKGEKWLASKWIRDKSQVVL